MKTRLYIAYGSNLNIAQMERRCPTAKPIAKSWLHDYKLEFRGNPYNAHATVTPSEGDSVPVVVWEITAKDEKSLDHYEGVAGGYYTKEKTDVEVGGEMKKALIYIMTPQKYGLPSQVYFETVKQGYKDFNFDDKILFKAKSQSYWRWSHD